MYPLNKIPLCKQIVRKYLNDGPRLVLAAKCQRWQKREINGKASSSKKYVNLAVLTPRYEDRKVGLYLAAHCFYMQERGTSTCNGKKTKPPKDEKGTQGKRSGSCDGKNKHEKEEKKKGVLYYTLGFMLVGSVATVAYAEYDPEFREWLDARYPGIDAYLKVIFREDKSYAESYEEYKQKIKAYIIEKIQQMFKKESTSLSVETEEGPVVDDTVIEECIYKPPVPAFMQMQKQVGREEEHYTERRLISEKSVIVPVKDSLRKDSSDSAFANLPETHPLNLMELEKKIGDSAERAICAYINAINAIREYSKELYQLVDQAFRKPDSEAWGKLKEKALEKQQLLRNAENEIKLALENVDRLSRHLDNPEIEASVKVKERAKKNIERVTQDIEEAKRKYEKEAEALSVAQKFWKKVEDTRKFFNDDLTILFPRIRTRDKYLKMTDEEIGLLLSHLYQTILYYQKEFSKVYNVRAAKFKQTVERLQSGKNNLADVMLEAEMENEHRKLRLNNEKKELALKSDFEKKTRSLLERQREDQSEYLKDLLAWKEVEVERKLLASLDDRLDEIKSGYKLEVAGMTGRMKGLNVDMQKDASKGNQKQAQAQVLWSACQTLLTALNAATNNKPWTQQLHPLQAEISAIEKAADEKDELVQAIVAAVPKKALTRGVYSKSALKERFLKVKKLATRLAQVSDGGAPAFLLFLSLIESFLILKKIEPIPKEELANEPIDPAEFTTYDILLRAKYFLDRDDLEMTVKYMNLLQGAPKSIAKDWIQEALTLLETQQAADTLLAHACSNL